MDGDDAQPSEVMFVSTTAPSQNGFQKVLQEARTASLTCHPKDGFTSDPSSERAENRLNKNYKAMRRRFKHQTQSEDDMRTI